MGYDLNRFKSKLHDEVICCICFGVLESPYEIAECGHLFCEACIRRWIESPLYITSTCPIDRNEITLEDIRPAPEFITNYINSLLVKCDFASEGCIVNVALRDANRHRAQCPLNPMKPIACTRGCGTYLPPSQMLAHRCNMDLCEDAIIWNDIIEAAKVVVRRKNYRKYQNRHSILSATCKKFINLFTRWMADPRLQPTIAEYTKPNNNNNYNDDDDTSVTMLMHDSGIAHDDDELDDELEVHQHQQQQQKQQQKKKDAKKAKKCKVVFT